MEGEFVARGGGGVFEDGSLVRLEVFDDFSFPVALGGGEVFGEDELA